ncbi:MAG: hypothetical protein IJ816_01575 [Alloprevotella sp.]|nr:hypothetical protein [Alloprevotella sp.]
MRRMQIGRNSRRIGVIMLFAYGTVVGFAQQGATHEDFKYERSSLYSIMIKHDKNKYADTMESVFMATPTSSHFFDHSLNVHTISFNPKKDASNQEKNLTYFCEREQLAKRLVSKWFGFRRANGCFNVDLVKERGLYNATALDMEMAEKSTRGRAMLEDAGENLIKNTYVVFHDIRHIDKGKGWNIAKWVGVGLLSGVTATAAGFASAAVSSASSTLTNTLSSTSNIISSASNSISKLTQLGIALNIKSFQVRVTSYLYRLKWDDDVAGQFFSEYYTDNTEKDADKVLAYLTDNHLFQMEYVGKTTYSSTKSEISTHGVNTNEALVLKACTRAYDKALANLQHKYPEFRVKAPLLSIEPLTAAVGMKEDVTEKSRYEVLERVEGKNGKVSYRRVGIIKPAKDKIWDNRFMAVEESARNADLNFTTFVKVSGGDFYPGMLIREMK